MQKVRVYEMPDCKMVSSGIGMFGEEKFEAFDQWMSSQKRGMFRSHLSRIILSTVDGLRQVTKQTSCILMGVRKTVKSKSLKASVA